MDQLLKYFEEVDGVRNKILELLRNDPVCVSHLDLMDKNLWLLNMIATNPERTANKENNVVSLFGLRIFNNAISSIEQVRSGLYQTALYPVRDTFENASLLHLFGCERSHILKWAALTDQERRNSYSQGHIRRLLEPFDQEDQIPTRKRAEHYDFLTKYGGHFNLESLQVIKTGNDFNSGPFVSVDHAKAVLHDIAKWNRLACSNLLYLAQVLNFGFDPNVVKAYVEVGQLWKNKYMPAPPLPERS